MKKLIAVLMVMICFGSVTPCFSGTTDVDFYFDSGVKKYVSHDYKDAINDFTKVIQLNHKFIGAYYLRADAKLRLGKDKAAIRDFTQAIKLNSDKDILRDSYEGRGRAKAILKNFKSAVVDFTKAIQLDSENVEPYLYRAYVEQNMGNNTSAISDFTIVIESNPDKAMLLDSYKERGSTKIELKDYDGAIADETQAIQLDNTCAFAYRKRGIAKAKRGFAKIELNDIESGIKDYKTAAEDFNQAKVLYQSQNNKNDSDIVDSFINECSVLIQNSQSKLPQSKK